MFLRYSGQSICHKAVPDEHVEAIYNALIDDDADTFSEFVSNYDDLSDYYLPPSKYKLPKILSNRVQLISAPAFFGAENCLEFLNTMEVDTTKTDFNDLSIYHFAAAGGNLNIIRSFNEIEQNNDLKQHTPMYYAIRYDNVDIVKYFGQKVKNSSKKPPQIRKRKLHKS